MSVRDDQRFGKLFWAGVVVGWCVIIYGVWGALGIAEDTHPRSLAIWMVACLIVHDGVVAPFTFVTARMLRRTVPDRWWVLLRATLVPTVVLVLVSIPVLGRFGARRDNTSLLSRDYTFGLIAAIVFVWVAVGAVTLAARRRRVA